MHIILKGEEFLQCLDTLYNNEWASHGPKDE